MLEILSDSGGCLFLCLKKTSIHSYRNILVWHTKSCRSPVHYYKWEDKQIIISKAHQTPVYWEYPLNRYLQQNYFLFIINSWWAMSILFMLSLVLCCQNFLTILYCLSTSFYCRLVVFLSRFNNSSKNHPMVT